ncbi:hypothetical protein ACROYT_G002896 [Oculina patagonica]
MEYIHYVLPTLTSSLIMAVVMLLIVTILSLYNACRKLLIIDDGNRQLQKTEKIPEEHDERFATAVRRRRGSRLSLPCILTTG